MKIYAFGVRDDEKQAFEQISAQCGVEVTLSDETPSLENADLVKGYEGVTALGMGNIDRDLLSRYSENGVRFLQELSVIITLIWWQQKSLELKSAMQPTHQTVLQTLR